MHYVYVLQSERGVHYIGLRHVRPAPQVGRAQCGKECLDAGQVVGPALLRGLSQRASSARDRERVLKGHGRSKQALLARLMDSIDLVAG